MNQDAGKTAEVAKGLKGVLAADSAICHIEGEKGLLLYRGYNIDDLAERSTFEETAFLLFKGELPTRDELDQFRAALNPARSLPQPVSDFLRSLPRDVPPMTALRSAVSIAGVYDPRAEEESDEANFQKSIRLTGMLATIVAAIHRLRQGRDPVPPQQGAPFAEDFMRMLKGAEPTADEARAMDLVLILHAEHGFNASTFAARVICATLTDIYSAVTGAIGALKGKLHGGANTEVLKALMEVGSVENVAPWVEQMQARKEKFMGFGHAVYKGPDPRAKFLKELSRRLGEEQGNTKWYDISVEMEDRVVAAINRQCNVDFYSASLQHYMGVPAEMFTCIFAASRIVGWCAHILEQYADNKIIRPSSKYVGYDERAYVAIEKR
jgi:citrate synthase